MNEEIKEEIKTSEQIRSFPGNVHPPQKNEYERLKNHADTLLKEKKAHLKKIAAMEEKINRLENEKDTSNEKVADIFATAQNSAEQYYTKTKETADQIILEANQNAEKILKASQDEALAIRNRAKEESDKIYKKSKLVFQETMSQKLSMETTINEMKENSKISSIKSKENASKILSDATHKLELAEKKSKQILQYAEDTSAKIIDCTRQEYERLRSLIDITSKQYIELCKELAGFNTVSEYITFPNVDDEDSQENPPVSET